MASENEYSWEKFLVLLQEYREKVIEIYGGEEYIRDHGRTKKEWEACSLASKKVAFQELYEDIAQVKADFEEEQEEAANTWEILGAEAVRLLQQVVNGKTPAGADARSLVARMEKKLNPNRA